MIYLITLYSETHYLNFRACPLASKETPARYQSPSIPILLGPCNHKHIYFSLDFPILEILNRITQYLTFFTLFIWHSDFRAYPCCSLSINESNFFLFISDYFFFSFWTRHKTSCRLRKSSNTQLDPNLWSITMML